MHLHSLPTIKAQSNQVSSPGGTPFGGAASPVPLLHRFLSTLQALVAAVKPIKILTGSSGFGHNSLTARS
ncbi:MAG: hypothetical protein F6K55_19120 [Moorea sp. SIO4A3]|nr:hypothetical protein [Moorena sp. SIO4A3]